MLAMTSLISGSSGNCTLITSEEDAVLIDCGLSFRNLEKRLQELSFDINKIKAVFITHEHNDHISGLKPIINKLGVTAYFNMETSLALKYKKHLPTRYKIFENFSEINIGKLLIYPFAVPHDGANTVAYSVSLDEKKVAVATDFGFDDLNVLNCLQGCNALLLESNHDVEQLYIAKSDHGN